MGLRARHAGVAACLPMIIAGSVTAAAAKAPAPTVDPSHGGKAAAWRVITPPLVPTIGGSPPQHPHCHAADITAHATTRLIPGGVAGLIHLHGDHCEIHSKTGPDELRGGDATLDVTSVPLNKQKDHAEVPRFDVALDSGRAIWSFTWTGSWCGNHPTSVIIPLNKSHGEVMAPLRGPTPGCHANPGNQPSVLTAGPPGFPHQPDFAEPSSWHSLTATLHAPKVRRDGELPKLSVTLANPSETDIPLAPCPSYSLVVARGRHTAETADDYGRALPCPYQARAVGANFHVTIRLPHSHFDPRYVARPGRKVTVTFAILGVPPAVARVRVPK